MGRIEKTIIAIIFVAVVGLIVAAFGAAYSTSMDLQPFVPFIPFFASFFGVLSAFALQWIAKWYERRKDRKQFKKDIRHELETGITYLTGAAQLLPTDMWESGKASGFLSLISHEVRVKFAKVYFSIDSHNYESKKLWDESVLAFTTMEKPKVDTLVKSGDKILKVPLTPAQLWHSSHTAQVVDTEKGIKKLIEDLLKENIWE